MMFWLFFFSFPMIFCCRLPPKLGETAKVYRYRMIKRIGCNPIFSVVYGVLQESNGNWHLAFGYQIFLQILFEYKELNVGIVSDDQINHDHFSFWKQMLLSFLVGI